MVCDVMRRLLLVINIVDALPVTPRNGFDWPVKETRRDSGFLSRNLGFEVSDNGRGKDLFSLSCNRGEVI